MKILAFETIEMSASAALLDDENVLASTTLPPQQRSAQYLAPAVRDLLAQTGWKPTDVQLIVVSQGPGSFTGLRVGITFAKIFAWAVGADVIALNTLDILAEAVPQEFAQVSIGLDAQRGEVVVRTYERGMDGLMAPLDETRMIDLEDWVKNVPDGTILSGPVLAQKARFLPENLPTVPAEFWTPSVAQMGKMGFRLYQAGRRDDIWNLLPIYSRPAAAEERRMMMKK